MRALTDMTGWMPATPPKPDNPAWFLIDLQAPHNLLACEIFFRHQAALFAYLLEGSADGKAWTTLVDKRQADDDDVLAAQFHDHLSFKVVRLNRAKMIPRIQKRTTTFSSGQPRSSKWW